MPQNRESHFGDSNRTNITIRIPLRNGRDGWFDNIDKTVDAIEQDIRAFLFTNKGERVMRPDFGVGFIKYIFDPNDGLMESRARQEIEDGFRQYFPFVKLKKVEVKRKPNDDSLSENELRIKVEAEINFPDDIKMITIDKVLTY